jgi:hypothetical protein
LRFLPEDDVIVEVDCDPGTTAGYSHVSLSSDLLAVVGKHKQRTAAANEPKNFFAKAQAAQSGVTELDWSFRARGGLTSL